jgi:RNA polymerase sigma factor (sigma-70 family)
MKSKMRQGATRGELQIAREEFSEYYNRELKRWIAEDASRADWAPRNPNRLFNLALKTLYPEYRKKMSVWAFLAEIYKTLGFHSEERKGLFQKFDPCRYQGTLALADHFTNLFKKRLKANLDRAVRVKTDERRCKKPERYRGLRCASRTRWQKWELEGVLLVMVAKLGDAERVIIWLRYWEGLSDRKIGQRLDIDHKTVRRRHNVAIAKLLAFYENAFRARAA